MRKLLFLASAAIVMSALAVACSDNASSSNKDSGATANEQLCDNDSTSTTDTLANSIDSINPKGVATPMDERFQKSKKKALLIGVSTYKDRSWGKINSHNDIELLKPTLMSLGFEVIELTEQQATHDNIKAAFNEFTGKCNPSDTVIVHFSGHGQRMVDQEGDEPDTLSECFVPYDAMMMCSNDPNGYRGHCHLTDDEIHKFITALRQLLGKDGYLFISFDACYSGGASKNVNGSGNVVRGTNEIFGKGILTKAKRKGRFEVGTINNANYVVVSACQPKETNYEVIRDGKNYGSLSYILNMKLIEVKNGKLTFDRLATAVKDDTEYWKVQTPFIDKTNDETVQ